VKADRREFRFIEGSSRKFWAIELDGKSFSVHFGRIGTVGQAKEKTFSSEDLAKREYDKLISEKAKGGYVEVDASSMTSTPTLVAAKAAVKAEPTVTATRDAGKATAVGKSASEASATLHPTLSSSAASNCPTKTGHASGGGRSSRHRCRSRGRSTSRPV
jgi:predicted DNA-binding WGR domain protein